MRLTWRALEASATDQPGALLTVDGLADAGIVAAFSTRHGGRSIGEHASLNVRSDDGDPSSQANRERILVGLGLAGLPWIKGTQVHGAAVGRVDRIDAGPEVEGVDALVTDRTGVALAVHVADCMPVLLADPDRRRIAVVHAGWRGLVDGVIEAAAEALGPSAQTVAAIGPSIGPCCFEVGGEVRDRVHAAYGDAVLAGEHHIDLWRGAITALHRAGVTRILLSALCTRCEPHRFFSHRAGSPGRQALVAALT